MTLSQRFAVFNAEVKKRNIFPMEVPTLDTGIGTGADTSLWPVEMQVKVRSCLQRSMGRMLIALSLAVEPVGG